MALYQLIFYLNPIWFLKIFLRFSVLNYISNLLLELQKVNVNSQAIVRPIPEVKSVVYDNLAYPILLKKGYYFIVLFLQQEYCARPIIRNFIALICYLFCSYN